MNMSSVAAAFVAAAAIVSGCSSAPAGPPPGQGMPPTPVGLAQARAAPIEETTEYVATLKSLRSTTIQPQIDGQITQILVKSGDRVRQGAPLMQIDPRQQAQRSRDLYAAGAISKQEQERAETALRTAEADLKALQAQVQQQEVQLR